MPQAPPTLMDHILQQSPLLIGWVLWLIAINTASVLFVRHREARWVLVAWLVNFAVMNFLFEHFGFVRLLGLAHVLVWTPLLLYLWQHWPRPGASGAFRAWIAAVFLSNSMSLAIDYLDVLRYLAGDGALPS